MEEMKNTKKLTDDCDAAIKTAQFRFALIAPPVQGLVPDGSDTAYFMRITKAPLTLPDGRCVKYSWKTPQKWHYLYKKGGFDALLPKTRSDKGIPRSREWLEESFLNRVTRKVRKDATVPIDCVSYDVPMQFISQKVEIRYLPEDMDSAFILYEGEHFPIRATDKNENCRTKRENNPPVDYTEIGGGN